MNSADPSPVSRDFNYMLYCTIDHIVITAHSLTAGAEYVRQILGVTPQFGGEHQRMGTHNALLRLGEAMYLEVIAVNPDASRPDRRRWFELDRTHAGTVPGLATWVARTNDIRSAVVESRLTLGEIESMSRGEFNWLITIPADGSLLFGGIAPLLIQWLSETHSVDNLSDSGCSLNRLEGFHPDADKIAGMLNSIGFKGEFSVSPLPANEQPYLVAHIQTPGGVRQLRTVLQPSGSP
jgi:hypothetical protein